MNATICRPRRTFRMPTLKECGVPARVLESEETRERSVQHLIGKYAHCLPAHQREWAADLLRQFLNGDVLAIVPLIDSLRDCDADYMADDALGTLSKGLRAVMQRSRIPAVRLLLAQWQEASEFDRPAINVALLAEYVNRARRERN